MSDYVIPEIKATEAEMISIRHYLHANPELSLEEFNTSELVASKLTEWGYQVTRGLGKTGVVGSLSKGDSPRTIGLRADMDALPIEETTGLPWASTAPGKMHACGHDGHTTILLAAAKYIASPACQFNGTVHLIFQPAEEAIGGADLMIKDGLFEQFPCERIFGLHNMPGLPVGKLGFYAGNFMASADTVKITITGYGGHGAHPRAHRRPDRRRCGAGDGPAEHCGAQRAAGGNGSGQRRHLPGRYRLQRHSGERGDGAERAGDEAGNPRPADQAYSRAR